MDDEIIITVKKSTSKSKIKTSQKEQLLSEFYNYEKENKYTQLLDKLAGLFEDKELINFIKQDERLFSNFRNRYEEIREQVSQDKKRLTTNSSVLRSNSLEGCQSPKHVARINKTQEMIYEAASPNPININVDEMYVNQDNDILLSSSELCLESFRARETASKCSCGIDKLKEEYLLLLDKTKLYEQQIQEYEDNLSFLQGLAEEFKQTEITNKSLITEINDYRKELKLLQEDHNRTLKKNKELVEKYDYINNILQTVKAEKKSLEIKGINDEQKLKQLNEKLIQEKNSKDMLERQLIEKINDLQEEIRTLSSFKDYENRYTKVSILNEENDNEMGIGNLEQANENLDEGVNDSEDDKSVDNGEFLSYKVVGRASSGIRPNQELKGRKSSLLKKVVMNPYINEPNKLNIIQEYDSKKEIEASKLNSENIKSARIKSMNLEKEFERVLREIRSSFDSKGKKKKIKKFKTTLNELLGLENEEDENCTERLETEPCKPKQLGKEKNVNPQQHSKLRLHKINLDDYCTNYNLASKLKIEVDEEEFPNSSDSAALKTKKSSYDFKLSKECFFEILPAAKVVSYSSSNIAVDFNSNKIHPQNETCVTSTVESIRTPRMENNYSSKFSCIFPPEVESEESHNPRKHGSKKERYAESNKRLPTMKIYSSLITLNTIASLKDRLNKNNKPKSRLKASELLYSNTENEDDERNHSEGYGTDDNNDKPVCTRKSCDECIIF